MNPNVLFFIFSLFQHLKILIIILNFCPKDCIRPDLEKMLVLPLLLNCRNPRQYIHGLCSIV